MGYLGPWLTDKSELTWFSEHSPMSSDHRAVHTDPTPVLNDHISAYIVHKSVLNDHIGVFNDHRPVFNDHTRAYIDHRGVFSDHTGVFSDHRPVFSMHSMVIGINIDYNGGFWSIFGVFRPVFRMCLMVIDVCIDRTLGVLAEFTSRRFIGSPKQPTLSVYLSVGRWRIPRATISRNDANLLQSVSDVGPAGDSHFSSWGTVRKHIRGEELTEEINRKALGSQ